MECSSMSADLVIAGYVRIAKQARHQSFDETEAGDLPTCAPARSQAGASRPRTSDAGLP